MGRRDGAILVVLLAGVALTLLWILRVPPRSDDGDALEDQPTVPVADAVEVPGRAALQGKRETDEEGSTRRVTSPTAEAAREIEGSPVREQPKETGVTGRVIRADGSGVMGARVCALCLAAPKSEKEPDVAGVAPALTDAKGCYTLAPVPLVPLQLNVDRIAPGLAEYGRAFADPIPGEVIEVPDITIGEVRALQYGTQFVGEFELK